MSFNPYNYQRYTDIGQPQLALPPKAGMSFEEIQEYRRIRRDADEAMRRDREMQEYYTQQGSIARSQRGACQIRAFEEGLVGRSDCGGGSAFD